MFDQLYFQNTTPELLHYKHLLDLANFAFSVTWHHHMCSVTSHRKRISQSSHHFSSSLSLSFFHSLSSLFLLLFPTLSLIIYTSEASLHRPFGFLILLEKTTWMNGIKNRRNYDRWQKVFVCMYDVAGWSRNTWNISPINLLFEETRAQQLMTWQFHCYFCCCWCVSFCFLSADLFCL